MSKVDEMVSVLRNWQGLERQALNDTAEIIEKSPSSLIRLLMEIIRHDSLMHHRVQQLLIDSVTRENVTVTREDIAAVWDKIQAHDRMEKRTIELAQELKKKAWTPVHKLLLDYLIRDESKHDTLLEQLDAVKKDLTQSSGA